MRCVAENAVLMGVEQPSKGAPVTFLGCIPKLQLVHKG